MHDDTITFHPVALNVYADNRGGCPHCRTNAWMNHPEVGFVCLACLTICMDSLSVPDEDRFDEGILLYCQMHTPRSTKGN